jgi:hypothetical protein
MTQVLWSDGYFMDRDVNRSGFCAFCTVPIVLLNSKSLIIDEEDYEKTMKKINKVHGVEIPSIDLEKEDEMKVYYFCSTLCEEKWNKK